MPTSLRHVITAAIVYSRGRFAESLRHCEAADGIYDCEKHRSHALLYGIEPGVLSRMYAGLSLWRLGNADQARQRATDGLFPDRAQFAPRWRPVTYEGASAAG